MIDSHIYVKNIRAKFHPDPIWDDEAIGLLKRSPQQQEEDQDDE